MNITDCKVDVPVGKSEHGDWEVVKYKVSPEDEHIQRLRCAFNPQRPARVVPAGTYTALTRNGEVIMSDTPDELRDFLPAVEAAKGHCLVSGLGLGAVAAAMLRKPEVEKVTVVELSVDVLELVGKHLKAMFGDRLELVNADINEWTPEPGVVYDLAWHDIFDNISPSNLPVIRRLRRKFSKVCKWQGFWSESQLRRLR